MTHRWICLNLMGAYERVLADVDASVGLDALPSVLVTFERSDDAEREDPRDDRGAERAPGA